MPRLLTACLTALVVLAGTAYAQQPPIPPKPLVPLEVEVVLSRYQGDKKISSIPYTLNVNANGSQTVLNMGTEVPVASTTFTPVANGSQGQPQPLRSYNYRSVGMNIDLRATTEADGLYQLALNINDSSVVTPDTRQQAALMPDTPAFRTFKGSSALLLKDGQSRQITVATDRVSGEVLKVDVSLKVLKN